MHEFGLAENMLRLALDQARQRDAQHIHQINMRIGDLSGVVLEAFEFAFEALAGGTIADRSRLLIERVPVSCYCSTCSAEFEVHDFHYDCPRCGRPSSDVRRGRELNLVSMEVS